MFAKSSLSTAVATALALVSTARATLTDELRDRKLPNCDSTLKLNDIQNKGDFWYYTGAQQYADDYINSNTDHTLWAQNLYRELLGKEIHSDFDCTTTEANCVPDAKCGKFQRHVMSRSPISVLILLPIQRSGMQSTRVVFTTSTSR